ncbi:DUF192 domain-containing protein [Candidatus Sumerlaeota bacterium]|nr:DUF192 domain-containing protein [Candidatus Sumerlaeota bacterium]
MARVRNTTQGTLLGDSVDVARTKGARTRGLLGRRRLSRGEGMWIVPCGSIHTLFMQFAIDVLYLDREQRVVRMEPALRPWNFSWGPVGAQSVLELPAGVIRATGTQTGDRLAIEE